MYNGVSRVVNVSGIKNNPKIQDHEAEVEVGVNVDNYQKIEKWRILEVSDPCTEPGG